MPRGTRAHPAPPSPVAVPTEPAPTASQQPTQDSFREPVFSPSVQASQPEPAVVAAPPPAILPVVEPAAPATIAPAAVNPALTMPEVAPTISIVAIPPINVAPVARRPATKATHGKARKSGPAGRPTVGKSPRKSTTQVRSSLYLLLFFVLTNYYYIECKTTTQWPQETSSLPPWCRRPS
jgi:hypothetical protein